MMPEPEPVMQPVQIVERPLGPLKTIIDKELERSCFEKSERALADEAIADSCDRREEGTSAV